MHACKRESVFVFSSFSATVHALQMPIAHATLVPVKPKFSCKKDASEISGTA